MPPPSVTAALSPSQILSMAIANGIRPTSTTGTLMFEEEEICNILFHYLSPLNIARMASVSRTLYSAVKQYRGRAYNINKRLERFFPKDQVLSFRSLMARTRMVISGSFALQFLDRSFYPESDLDLYAHPDKGIIEIGNFLTSQGYAYQPEPWQSLNFQDGAEHMLENTNAEHEDPGLLYPFKSIRAVYTFERPVEGHSRVQIVVSHISPLASILEFHSSMSLPGGELKRQKLTAFFSLRHERHRIQRRVLAIPICNVRASGLPHLEQLGEDPEGSHQICYSRMAYDRKPLPTCEEHHGLDAQRRALLARVLRHHPTLGLRQQVVGPSARHGRGGSSSTTFPFHPGPGVGPSR